MLLFDDSRRSLDALIVVDGGVVDFTCSVRLNTDALQISCMIYIVAVIVLAPLH